MPRGGARLGAGRKRELSLEQRLWIGSEYGSRCRAEAIPDVRQILRIVLWTGATYKELARLRCRDVDLKAKTISLHAGERGHTTILPMGRAAALFEQLMAGKETDDLVFAGQSAAIRELRKYAAIEDVAEIWEDLNKVPVAERDADGIAESAHRAKANARLRQAIEDIAHAMGDGAVENGKALFPPGGLLTITKSRLYGQRKSIARQVAALATERYQVEVGTRMVRSCWEEFSAIERRIIDDDQ